MRTRKNPASRKLYNALAEDLRIDRNGVKDSAEALYGFDSAVNAVADVLKRDNARFDKERFMRACGIGVGHMSKSGTQQSRGNPPLVVFGNPRTRTRRNPGQIVATGKDWEVFSDNIVEIRYQHKQDGQYYQHKFRPGQAQLIGSAGSPAAVIRRRDGKPLVRDY